MVIQDCFSSIIMLIIICFRLYIVGLYAVFIKVFPISLVYSLGSGRVSTWWTAVDLIPHSSEPLPLEKLKTLDYRKSASEEPVVYQVLNEDLVTTFKS